MPGSERGGTAVNGFLNFYKPVGITSMEALRRVKRITGQRKKVGHAGTMDPLASGVLPICFGQATRLMEQVVSGRKQYRMTVRLGESSTTYDAEGVITQVADPAGLSHQVIHQALQNFIGLIPQIPPMFSALKVDGQRLYDLARAGKEITRRPRTIEIFSITIDSLNLPDLDLTIDCGPGTYMRSVAHDLGQMLGCGGYVTALSRSSCGGFRRNGQRYPGAAGRPFSRFRLAESPPSAGLAGSRFIHVNGQRNRSCRSAEWSAGAGPG